MLLLHARREADARGRVCGCAVGQVQFFWRAMENMEVDVEQFRQFGGCELAPVSTAADKAVRPSLAACDSDATAVEPEKSDAFARADCPGH